MIGAVGKGRQIDDPVICVALHPELLRKYRVCDLCILTLTPAVQDDYAQIIDYPKIRLKGCAYGLY